MDTDTDSDTDTDTDADTDTDTDADTDTDTDADTDTDTDADTDTDTDTDSDADTDSDTDTDSDSDSETDSEEDCQDNDDCPVCQICNVAKECVNADHNTDPKLECDKDQSSSCGKTGVCDGYGSCEQYGPETDCDDGNPSTITDVCDGLGNCSGTPYCELYECWEIEPTHQDKCYDDDGEIECPAFPCQADGDPAFCGQDAQYPSNQRVFTVKTIESDKLIEDSLTGLVWQHDYAANLDWQSAIDHCKDSTYANQSDWRLPTYHEIAGIVDYSRYFPVVDTDLFPIGTLPGMPMWTSSVHVNGSSESWRIALASGALQARDQAEKMYVRCVRQNKNQNDDGRSLRYFVSGTTGTETVFDRATGLTWQLSNEPGLTWEQSLKHCEGLSYSSESDWRLPTIAELRSLVNIVKIGEVASDFPDLLSLAYRTSTTNSNVGPFGTQTHGISFALPELWTYSNDSTELATKCVLSDP